MLTGLVAQTAKDVPQRVELKRADLAGAPGMEVIESITEFKPGEGGELHVHHGLEASYVIQGATIRVAGREEPIVVPAGISQLTLRGVKHGAFTVIGDTSLKSFAVHIVDKGQPLYDYSK